MYISMYIYTNTEMHRFYRNAENPGICVYKEKRTQAVNTTQSTEFIES